MASVFGDIFDPLKKYNEQSQQVSQLGSIGGTGEDPLASLRQQRSYGGAPSPGGAPGAYTPGMLSSRQVAQQQFGVRDIGGYRAKGSVKNSDHPASRAYDFMTGIGNPQGQRLADYMVQQSQNYGVKYVIYNKRIWKPGTGWRPYKHPGGNTPTLNHEDHVHVSYN